MVGLDGSFGGGTPQMVSLDGGSGELAWKVLWLRCDERTNWPVPTDRVCCDGESINEIGFVEIQFKKSVGLDDWAKSK